MKKWLTNTGQFKPAQTGHYHRIFHIYVSNESPVNVYFDNLQVRHTRSPILEETHYYPFGLTMAGISSRSANTLQNKMKYNGKEEQRQEFSDGGGLEWSDFGRRMYDNQIGRFFNQDRYSEKYSSLSSYHYAANNPLLFIDNNGDSLIINAAPGNTTAVNTFQNQVNTGLGGFYTLGQSSTGRYVLNATGQKGKITAEQEAFYNTMNEAISIGTDVSFTVVDGNDAISHNVTIGDCACYTESPVNNHTIDVGDAGAFGSNGYITTQGIIGHEIKEGFEIQTKGLKTATQINNAHSKDAIGAENAINGNIRLLPPTGGTDFVGNQLILNVNAPIGVNNNINKVTITVLFTNGNVTNVTGNNKPLMSDQR